MLNNLITSKIPETVKDCDVAVTYLEEKLQGSQGTAQEISNTDCEEFTYLIIDNVRYEICGVYHGPDPVTWRDSKRKSALSIEAEKACIYPTNHVLVEDGLLDCKKSMMLDDFHYALDKLNALKKKGHFRSEHLNESEKQVQKVFIERMDRYFDAAREVISTTLYHSSELPSVEKYYASYFSKAIQLPQPIGMESNLLYTEYYLRTHDNNKSKTIDLYLCMTPIRPAYMAKKLMEAAKQPRVEQVRLYCGIGHTGQIMFLLENPGHIDKYLSYGTR